MKKFLFGFAAILPVFFLLLAMVSVSGVATARSEATPTPTYDPLEEPVLPENATEYELGRNWYWHYCMPCHGDRGQGLTDEWRAVWEPDHQDCWGKGCHAGERIEDSFAIPTVVPPVVSSVKLARFSSVQALSEYLKATHPPQDPGCLEEQQYQAIALYIFSENDRPLVELTLSPTVTPVQTSNMQTETMPAGERISPFRMLVFLGVGIILIGFAMWGIRKRR